MEDAEPIFIGQKLFTTKKENTELCNQNITNNGQESLQCETQDL